MGISITTFAQHDPRLDWISKHDSRSLNYLAREIIPSGIEIRPRRWRSTITLDQGQEGACVGFGWTQELLTSPRPFRDVTLYHANRYALDYYRACQRVDQWAGENYSGTSVLAGAHIAVARKFINAYRWALHIRDVRDSVIQFGPVVIGIPWYDSMYQTSSSGLVTIGGNLVGGHCLVVDEYHPAKKFKGDTRPMEVFGWHNSWGDDYGVKGRGYIRYEDLRDLLAHVGEACVPTGRKIVRF